MAPGSSVPVDAIEKCIYCGAKTKLYIKGVPVCSACSKDLDAGRKPPYREPQKPPGQSNKAS